MHFPGPVRRDLRKAAEWESMSGDHLSGHVMWADCGHTHNQTRAGVVGPVKTETCTLQQNLTSVTPHFPET